MSNNILPFASIKKIHIIGVCGTLMGAFATYLKRQGLDVSGSDQNIYPPMSDVLKNAGVKLFQGYAAENLRELQPRPDLVVIGNVISGTNPEAREALDGKYVYTSLPEAMEQLFLEKTHNCVVAGTHGKTTTSSLLAFVLTRCRKNPSYFIGGISRDLPFSFHLADISPNQKYDDQKYDDQKSDPKLFVLEGDEYDTAFWDKVPKFNHYLPNDVILTSIEYDHADIYPDFQAVIKAFEGLLSRICSKTRPNPTGRLIACFDYVEVVNLAKKAKVPVISYGTERSSGARFSIGAIDSSSEFTAFEILDQGRVVEKLKFRLSGRHNILNAMAVWIECQELGLDPQEVREAFSQFQGVKRRQEVCAEIKGVMVIDDFAHHPTAVRETLKALRMKYPEKRLIAVFEPRSATSRRKIFQKEYSLSFEAADQVIIASPYDQSKIASDNQFSSAELVADLIRKGKDAKLLGSPNNSPNKSQDNSVDSGVKDLAASLLAIQASASVTSGKAGILVAVLSNGGFDGFIPKLLAALRVA